MAQRKKQKGMSTGAKVLLALLGAGVIGGIGYFVLKPGGKKVDQFGNSITTDSTPAGGENILLNGKKGTGGWIDPATLQLSNGYWVGVGSDGNTWYYNGSTWIQA